MPSEMGYQVDREPASFVRRAGAFVIDLVAVGFIWFGAVIVAVIPDSIANPDQEEVAEPWSTIATIVVLALPAFWFVYHWIANAIGVSIGKRMLSISIEPTISAQPSSILRGLIRAVGQLIGAIPLGLGYWSALWDPENRAWHDKLAGTRVVRGTQPAEKPRAAARYLEEPRPGALAKNIRFACEPSSPAAGVRYVELRREGVRFEDEHGLRGFRFEDVEEAKLLPTGDVELQFKGHDPFGRPNEQVVRFIVHDRNPFLAELESRVKDATGKELQVARVGGSAGPDRLAISVAHAVKR